MTLENRVECTKRPERASDGTSARYSRERSYHNQYFSQSMRRRASRFYTIVRESRALYERFLLSHCRRVSALEYGCGTGSYAPFLARNGADHVVGIDLSSVAIKAARDSAEAAGLAHIDYLVMNAERLLFEDASFDLVCGTSILHHLHLGHAYAEIARVLKPGGVAAFIEPLGHNPFINMYRRATPDIRTADEHPLLMRDLARAEEHFTVVKPRFFILQTLAAVPFYGRPFFEGLLARLERADALLFRIFPPARRFAWQVVLALEDPVKR